MQQSLKDDVLCKQGQVVGTKYTGDYLTFFVFRWLNTSNKRVSNSGLATKSGHYENLRG